MRQMILGFVDNKINMHYKRDDDDVLDETYMLMLAPITSISSSTLLTLRESTAACWSPQWSNQPV